MQGTMCRTMEQVSRGLLLKGEEGVFELPLLPLENVSSKWALEPIEQKKTPKPKKPVFVPKRETWNSQGCGLIAEPAIPSRVMDKDGPVMCEAQAAQGETQAMTCPGAKGENGFSQHIWREK
ncbi:unnamed protein product [Caretta caretta]